MRSAIIEKRYTIDDEYYYSIIRKNIKKYRLMNKLTQQQLADMTEISREYICYVENESRNKHITIFLLGRIAEVLNVDIGVFFSRVVRNLMLVSFLVILYCLIGTFCGIIFL